MNNCEYVRDYYGVNAEISRLVTYKDRPGIIYEDGGNYIRVNFDDEKPGSVHNIHPTDPDLIYLDEFGTIRKMTRSQLVYQEFLRSETELTFPQWLGIN